MGLFLDLLHLSPRATDDALEHIYKSQHDHDGEESWKPHESKLIQRLIELFTARGLDRLSSIKKEIEAWTLGQRHVPTLMPVPTPPGAMHRWTAPEMAMARAYLEALPPAQWTLEDHMLAVDMVVQYYMPADLLHAEAEWLATRATLMGKVQANMAAEPTLKQADTLLAALPSTVAGALQQFATPPALASVLTFGRARAVENVVSLTDDVRHRMRATVMRHLEEQSLGAPAVGRSDLKTKLVDQFGALNRDWRRIAITEAGECALQGFVASLPLGAKIKRVEQYANACAFCRSIDGRVATVVDPASGKKDGAAEVWVGKNNVGRSASPKKRLGDVLVARTPEEMWHLPAGLAHPNCRGRWVLLTPPDTSGDNDFATWLHKHLS